MDLIILLSLLGNLVVLIQGRTDAGPENVFRPDVHTHFDVYANALSKAHYNPWACDYRFEPGYKCLSCSSALHCYPGNFALLVQCAGIFPFCRNGYCSRFKTEGCIQEENDPNTHIANHSTMPPYVQVFHKDNKTSIVHDESVTSTQSVINEPVLQGSASNTGFTTEVNNPNKIIGGMTSTNAVETSSKPNKIGKPKKSISVSEAINSL